MSEKRVISIRFCMDNKEDMEIYVRLEKEAGKSASLASIVKSRIRDSYREEDVGYRSAEFMEKIAEVIRKEMQESGMQMIHSLSSYIGKVDELDRKEENKLPEISEELPNGALDFLEF